jgi:hypothetical protein
MKLTRVFGYGNSEGFWVDKDEFWNIYRLGGERRWRVCACDHYEDTEDLSDFLRSVGLHEDMTTFKTRREAIAALEEAIAGAPQKIHDILS